MKIEWTARGFERDLEALTKKRVHLEQVRFPNYRNLRSGAVLSFTCPITVLLGRNGTNKSSVLQAVYGCGKGRSVGEFWFETALDAIPETNSDGLKQSVAHTYRANDALVECLKSRAPRGRQDPDYWEAVKPTRPYGFPASAARTPPISVEIEYLDFREVLPAFDKYFYFYDRRHIEQRNRYALAQRTKSRIGTEDKREKRGLRRSYRPQDYLRRRAPAVKRALDEDGRDLSPETLAAASYVLGRNYVRGRHVEHSLYWGHNGSTLFLQTKDFDAGYSDAYAGSGESAAITLIETIERTKRGSLIILDEPETSLHILAQQRMLHVLVSNAVRKDLQFVIASHSLYFADRLPPGAVKLLRETCCDGKIEIVEGMSATEAIHDTADLPRGKTILVEDERAKSIVLAAFRGAQGNLQDEFDVRVCSGGASTILADIKVLCATGRHDVLVILDGDQRPSGELPGPDLWPSGLAQLKNLIAEQTKGSNKKGQDLSFQDKTECTSYLTFLNENCFYLPGTTPESIVWIADHLRENYEKFFEDWDAEAAALENIPDHKERIRKLANDIAGLDAEAVYRKLLADLLASSHPNARLIKKDLVAWVRKHTS
jgi:hypothetical protein